MCFLQTDTCREGWETAQKNGYLCFIKWVFVIVQLLSHVQLFVTLWTAAHQASLSFTISWSLLRFMAIESVVPSNHLNLCCPSLLLPSVFPSIRLFSSESGKSLNQSALKMTFLILLHKRITMVFYNNSYES